MILARRITGTIALVSYLVMGAMLYFTVLPGADGLWPPDFHLRGYSAATMDSFTQAISDEARSTYASILLRWDRIFILSLAIWMMLTGWRGDWLRYAVIFLAVIYAGVDLAENAAIFRFVCLFDFDAAVIAAASSLTMAKFASLFCAALSWSSMSGGLREIYSCH
jgi:hypothetical protein